MNKSHNSPLSADICLSKDRHNVDTLADKNISRYSKRFVNGILRYKYMCWKISCLLASLSKTVYYKSLKL